MFESSGKLDSPSPDSGLPVPGTYNHALPIFAHTRGSLIVEARLKSPAKFLIMQMGHPQRPDQCCIHTLYNLLLPKGLKSLYPPHPP